VQKKFPRASKLWKNLLFLLTGTAESILL